MLVSSTPLPPFNFNSKSAFSVSVLVTDAQGTQATVSIALSMSHSNRPPTWTPPATYYTAAATNTTSIGSPLSLYVSDLDLGVVPEALTFSLSAVGNTGGTFAVDPSSGRLFVAALGSPSFNFPNTFALTACVHDAGIDGPVYTSCANFSVILTQNQNPPTLPMLNLTILEGSTAGAVVAQINATSINAGAVLSYSLAPGAALLNLPFPFAITTVNATPFNLGVVSVTDASPIRYSPYAGTGNFRSYPIFVSATDSRLGFPLTTTVATSIDVIWVVDGPFFDPAANPPVSLRNYYTVAASAPEHPAANTSVYTALALHKDPWQLPLLRYSIVPNGPFAGYFTVDPVAGTVAVSAAGSANAFFNDQRTYSVVVQALDSYNLTDSMTVLVSIVDGAWRARA